VPVRYCAGNRSDATANKRPGQWIPANERAAHCANAGADTAASKRTFARAITARSKAYN
jgi:hypothetical protein